MKYREITPCERLRPYVKSFFVFESEATGAFNDIVFPSGQMEVIFNLGEGIWKSSVNDTFHTTPPVELWGQITQPLRIQSIGKHTMLGARFFTHTAAYFLDEQVWEFNNQIADLRDLLGPVVRTLHNRLMETPQLDRRIALLENFLLDRLTAKQKKAHKIAVLGRIVQEMQTSQSPENIAAIADRYDITSRYLQKLFLQHTGITPKLYNKINRFQLSLRHMAKGEESLTTIAYACGYFDQSHFIRDFKSFTGLTPSSYSPEAFPVSLAFANP
jgi:AraC-like DNA-binding protein